ncbi:glycoside hydrolase family 31 protein [Sporolactobacillus sp. STCC-11]|uniref:glycoside hydrolase family 31 protein n=1 Tax=Sporolactobacillus caesalpiniae TaxID=3230362 RepID=UPI003390DFB1
MYGNLIGYQQRENKVIVQFEKSEAVIETITPAIIRFFVSVAGLDRKSKAIENLNCAPGSLTTHHADGVLTICTEKLVVTIKDEFYVTISDRAGHVLSEDYQGDGKPFIRKGSGEGLAIAAEEGHKLEAERNKLLFKIEKKLDQNTFFYGLGDKTGHLNKKGYHYKMWNTDNPSPHVESFDALYKSIPFLITLKEKQAFGYFLDNTFESIVDLGKENSDYYSFGAVGGDIDYYFIYGPSVKSVINRYTDLTGTTPLPQLWTLGYQQCRWSYTPENRLREIADNFREKDIPCDALYLDIDYMDGYRVFTWDHKKFPDPKRTLELLKKQGFKVVTIIDPGVKKDKGYSVYDQGIANDYFATDKDLVPYVNKVWPGDALYPDFSNEKVRNWWAGNQKIMTDTGVAGIWNDMNEPASFNGPLPDDVLFNNDGVQADHREVHNVYGHYMSKATYEGIKQATGKRPFVITRACYAGTQKYATVWTGDNQSLWEHLRMSLPMLMNLGLSGIAFCGTDVGGFGFDCTAELLSRWVQVGAFTPLFRNHSSIYTRDQEPWAFDDQTEAINRKYIKLRYQLLPYLYDLLHDGESSGLPVIRPLFLHYQDDVRTYEINDEFLCGDSILVAPVVEQGARTRLVYLPEGNEWIDFWTKEVFAGGHYIVREAPLDLCPIYIKGGSIVPLYPVQNYVGEQEIKQLTLDVYLTESVKNGSYIHYQDDGESFNYQNGGYNLYELSIIYNDPSDDLTLSIKMKHNGYRKAYESFKIILNHTIASEVILDGEKIPYEVNGESTYLSVDHLGTISIKL